MAESTLQLADHLEMKRIIAAKRGLSPALKSKVSALEGRSDLSRLVLNAIPHLTGRTSDKELAEALVDRLKNTLVVESRLHLLQHHADGRVTNHGVVAAHSDLITTAGVNYLVGILTGANASGTVEKYHALGTGTTAAAIGDTALQSEIAAGTYSTGTRGVGTTAQGSSANIYQSVATNTIASVAVACTELGLMTAGTLGTLIDHFVFSVINLAIGDSLNSTVNITYSAGG